MALKHLPQVERLLSGVLQALLSDSAMSMTISNPPTKYPCYIEIEPGSDNAETVKAISVAGNIVTLAERGVYNGGVGSEHIQNSTWKQKWSAKVVDAIVDALESGYLMEDGSLTITRDSDTEFTIEGIDESAFYTEGTVVRFNESDSYIGVVSSAVYAGGDTTITMNYGTIPASITSVEVEIGPRNPSLIPAIIARLVINDSATTPPVNLTARNTEPTAPVEGDIYMDDGTNTASGLPGFKRYNATDEVWYDLGGAAGDSFWTEFPDTITRVDGDTISIPDTGNTNNYNLLFTKGTVIQWVDSGTKKYAMIFSSSYSSNTVTIELAGDTLNSGSTDYKYAAQKAIPLEFIAAGNQATGTAVTRIHRKRIEESMVPFHCDANVLTAGITNSTTYDINDDGTTIYSTQGNRPSIASAATEDTTRRVPDNPSTNKIAANSVISVDIDAASTTQAQEGYLTLWVMPWSWNFR